MDDSNATGFTFLLTEGDKIHLVRKITFPMPMKVVLVDKLVAEALIMAHDLTKEIEGPKEPTH